MDLSALIENKINEGKVILSGLSSMRETSGMAINVTYYMSEDVDEAIRKINKWQLTTKDIIIDGYGSSHRYVSAFENTITKKDSGYNYKLEFEHEMNEGLSVLEGISESLMLGLDDKSKFSETLKSVVKPPLAFISHAEFDKEFANEIVTLLEFVGVKDILCTSVDGYRIPLGRDIIEYLRETFNNYNLFVIILHTHNYYTRSVCLNEMGAAWALKTRYFSVLAPDFEFSDMTGVVNDRDVAIKIGATDCESRLNQFKNELVSFFSLPEPNENRWPHYRRRFTEACLNLYDSKITAVPTIKIIDNQQSDALVALSTKFRFFYNGNGCYPFQIDIKFASRDKDIYFKTITLSNKKHHVEFVMHDVVGDVMSFNRYLKPHTLNINKTGHEVYPDKIGEYYKTIAIYIEDHKLPCNALETMSFHDSIVLERQTSDYDVLPLEDWELRVTYNLDGELMIPLKAVMLE